MESDQSPDFSVEESRRRRSAVTGESEEVRARVKVKRRNTDDDAISDGRGEDEDENVEIIGERLKEISQELHLYLFPFLFDLYASISILPMVKSFPPK